MSNDERTPRNPIWHAYALMAWPLLLTFGRHLPVKDEDGNPVKDEDDKPKTEWVKFTSTDMTETAIEIADALYAAEMSAEDRRLAAIEKKKAKEDNNA